MKNNTLTELKEIQRRIELKFQLIELTMKEIKELNQKFVDKQSKH